jgi:hypothetical protein
MMTSLNDGRGSAGKPPLGKSVVTVVLATACLLLIPLTAMQFTTEVNWGPEDFLAAGIMLGGTGLMYVAAARAARTTAQRRVMGCLLAMMLLVVWAELAVGIFH